MVENEFQQPDISTTTSRSSLNKSSQHPSLPASLPRKTLQGIYLLQVTGVHPASFKPKEVTLADSDSPTSTQQLAIEVSILQP